MKILFIINPISGDTDKDFLYDYIKQLEEEDTYDVKYYETQPKGNVENIKEKLHVYQPDRIIVAGGDGTIQLVSKCVIESESTASIGIVPTGSANGLSTCLELPKDLDEALTIAVRSKTEKAIDVLLIDETHYCVHLFDLGVNALLIKYYEADGARGMLGYTKHVLSAINDSEVFDFTIENETGKFKTSAQIVICTNGNKFGTGVKISNGSIFDGYFDLTIIEEVNFEEVIKSGLSLLDIQLTDDQFDRSIKSKSTRISTNAPVPFQIDGEYMGEISKLHVKVLESAIKIILNE